MKKALMYLLLAFGITIAVLLVGGALVGFISGFIDGYNEQAPGTTNQFTTQTILFALVLLVADSIVLHWVFLRMKFASYDLGLTPKNERWKVVLPLMLVMGGLALLFAQAYNPMAPIENTPVTEVDFDTHRFYIWMHDHPFLVMPFIIIIDATCDLVIYGGVLRELLEWKHRPMLVVGVFALLMGASYYFMGDGMLEGGLALVTFLIQGWTYECTRSIVPLIIADVFYWVVFLLVMGIASPWVGPLAMLIIVPSLFFLIKTMDAFKPID